MFRLALLALALLALGGCSTVSFQFNSQKSEKPQAEARPGTPSATCSQDCTLQISMAATAPRGGSGPGANDCTAVTFSYRGKPFESLAVSKGKQAEMTLTLNADTQKFAFFGSDPVSLYNANKSGPLDKKGLTGKVDVEVVDKATVKVRVNRSMKREEFHFGVALGTAKGGCAGDPSIINGAD
jgi:hypothetical protein